MTVRSLKLEDCLDAVDPEAPHLAGRPSLRGQMKAVRRRTFLLRRKASRDAVATRQRRQMPCEGQDVSPMAVLVELGANPRHIPSNKRILESKEPVFGRT